MSDNRKTMDIFISEKFRNVLENFKNDSIVAKLLLYKRIDKTQLQESAINYISVSEEDPSKISYLTQDRIKKLEESGDDFWTSKIRFRCKPGAFVNKIFKDIPANEIEKFSNLYKTFSSKKEMKFKIIKGNDIIRYYDRESYQSEDGSLGCSCMKYPKCSEYGYFNLYRDTDSVSMLILTPSNGEKILGRALLWDFTCALNEDSQKKYKIMDRIYTTQDDEYQYLFKKWAIENGYLYKTNQNWKDSIKFDDNSVTSEYRVGIKVNLNYVDRYPYLDTFKWLDLKQSILYNFKPEYFIEDNSKFVLLASPEGRYCDVNYIWFDNIERVYDYPGNLTCYDGVNYTNSSNCNYSETLDRFILKSESCYNEELRDYMYIDLSRVDSEIIENRRKLLSKWIESEKKLEEKVDYMYRLRTDYWQDISQYIRPRIDVIEDQQEATTDF